MIDLDRLIALARRVRMTKAQQDAQRLSFVYGNCAIENDRITWAMVWIAGERQKRPD